MEAEIAKTVNKELRKQARESLSGRWWLAVSTLIIFFIITAGIGLISRLGTIVSLLISGAMSVGLCYFTLAIARSDNPRLALIFYGFKKILPSLGAYILMAIFIILWALIGIIPGIIGFAVIASTHYIILGKLLIALAVICLIPAAIAAISYSQTYFIIADNEIGPFKAICKSIGIIKGSKWKFFWLNISFIWWIILSAITLGIGFLWIAPYMAVTMAKFYDDIKAR
jgi:uncharacterized membrane protein